MLIKSVFTLAICYIVLNVCMEYVLIYHRHPIDFEKVQLSLILLTREKGQISLILFAFSCSDGLSENSSCMQVCASCAVKEMQAG
jgi:hypothetical protein